MSNVIINEHQLQNQIDELKKQFKDTKEIYREVCILLFFRYGITPTANKLYQYVRKGSMSAPADALNRFWIELRDKSRVRIERSDIPESIGSATGDFVSKLWVEAQKAAQSGFTDAINEAKNEILKYKLETETANKNHKEIQARLTESNLKLENALKKLSETDYLLRSNSQILADKEKSLKTLKNDNNALIRQIDDLKHSFSKDLQLVNSSLQKAEYRYLSLEKNALLEIDSYRQQIKKIERSVALLERDAKKDKNNNLKLIDRKQSQITSYSEKLGRCLGQLIALRSENRMLLKKLKSMQNNSNK
jgi:chromosome segregation ATPase